MIAGPPLSLENLERGHAVHFRYQHPDAASLRVDVAQFWLREGRTTEWLIELAALFPAETRVLATASRPVRC